MHVDRESCAAVVADDDDDARELVVGVMRKLGLHVEEASTGAGLIGRVRELQRRQVRISVVISDIGMPECDGIVAASQLLRENPALPIVLMTAFGDQLTVRRAKACGVRHVLRKPFSLTALSQIVLGLRVV